MNRGLLKILLMGALTVSALSCREPSIREHFIKSSHLGDDGRYHFEIDFSDSLALYDISFYTQLDEIPSKTSFPIIVYWKAPSGWTFSERVYWDSEREVVRYREDIIPSEYGTWGLAVYVGDYPNLCGLGVITEKKDGTR